MPVERLRWICPPRTAEAAARRFDRSFGQERAAEALRFALSTRAVQNAFVAARDAADRMPVVLDLVRRAAPPRALRTPLPAGLALEDPGDDGDEPVVVAEDLTEAGLFGRLVPAAEDGAPLRLRAGAILRADGGVLVLEAGPVVAQEELWWELRRVLRDRRVLVRPADGSPSPVSVPVAVRAVFVGEEATYARLFDADRRLAEVIAVKATLESTARATSAALRTHVAHVRALERAEGLRPTTAAARATLLEEAVRDGGRKGLVSLRFARVAGWTREADLVAGERGAARIDREDVLAARRRAGERLGVHERRVRQSVLEGIVRIDLAGSVVGQVNGLAVHDYGNLGKVARITATVGPGPGGIVNVEREVALSGASYDKGVHILAGWLTDVLACHRPASLETRIVFEQSYGHLTGDSATCAEACAVLSALARAPIRQDLAITGSMNQHGEVQAIGGVNEKIEGFHDLCAARGLTGTQGVVIPRSNVDDLMLRPDVVEACRRGAFRVHAIDRIEEGVELLTGRAAGRTSEPGRFRPGSVLAAASERLDLFSGLAP